MQQLISPNGFIATIVCYKSGWYYTIDAPNGMMLVATQCYGSPNEVLAECGDWLRYYCDYSKSYAKLA